MITRSRASYVSALDPSCPVKSEEPSYSITSEDGVLVADENAGGQGGGFSAAISGIVSVDSRGCWVLRSDSSAPAIDVVWPAATRWTGDERKAVKLSTAALITSGDSISGAGGLIEKVAKTSISISPDVPCLTGNEVSYYALGDPAQVRVTPGR